MSKNSRGIMRYIRAFVGAFGMTLRGKKPPTDQAQAQKNFPKTLAWTQEAARLITEIEAAFDSAGVNPEMFKLKIERRDVSAKLMLDTLRFHHTQENIYLLKNQVEHSLMGVHANNLNDRFMVMSFTNAEGLPEEVRESLSKLGEHLAAIPPENNQ